MKLCELFEITDKDDSDEAMPAVGENSDETVLVVRDHSDEAMPAVGENSDETVSAVGDHSD